MMIACFEVQKEDMKFLKKELPAGTFFTSRPLTLKTLPPAKLVNSIEILCIDIYSKVNAEVLKHFPKLRFITTRSTGFDHIDIIACKKRKISVSNVPAYAAETVAEHAFALLLSLSRGLSNKNKKLKTFSREGFTAFDLQGKTLGIIGTGRIGLHLAHIAKGFHMKVLAYDVIKNESKAQEMNFHYIPLEQLYKESDIISLHLPMLPETYHLLNARAFATMKPGVIILNTARGDLIHTPSLVKALQTKKVKAAALDVLEDEESLKADRPTKEHRFLFENPQVLITPHIGYYSTESMQRLLATTVRNIQSFTRSNPEHVIS